jgi:hypothetical protein
MFENRVLWILHTELHDLYRSSGIIRMVNQDITMGRVHSMDGGDKKCIKNCGRESGHLED